MSSKASGTSNQDRVVHIKQGPNTVIVLADGAGGQSGGAVAAEMTVEYLQTVCSNSPLSPSGCSQLLSTLDTRLQLDPLAGKSTALVLVSQGNVVFGASVGDSEAWMTFGEEIVVLTANQQRKPLLGSELASPVAFGPVPLMGTLLLGTDGLFNFASRTHIIACVEHAVETNLSDRLVDLARLPSGGLQDDTTVIVYKKNTQPTTTRPKLLLVENHREFAKTVIGEFLSCFEVLCVATLLEATSALARESFVALIVDYDLDDGKGVAVIEAAIAQSMPPIIIAGSAHAAGNQALIEAGADAICPKLEFHKISEVFDNCVRRRLGHH